MLRRVATSSRIEARCCWICALRSASFCSAASCHRAETGLGLMAAAATAGVVDC